MVFQINSRLISLVLSIPFHPSIISNEEFPQLLQCSRGRQSSHLQLLPRLQRTGSYLHPELLLWLAVFMESQDPAGLPLRPSYPLLLWAGCASDPLGSSWFLLIFVVSETNSFSSSLSSSSVSPHLSFSSPSGFFGFIVIGFRPAWLDRVNSKQTETLCHQNMWFMSSFYSWRVYSIGCLKSYLSIHTRDIFV